MNIKKLKKFTENLKILYVEDDVAIADTMIMYLKKFFSDVAFASDGLMGLEVYKQDNFDIVITDLSMPKMNGLEMLKIIKELNPNQVVLITSAHSENNYLFSAIKIGIDGYIIKPYDYEQLNNELYKIAEKINLFQENEKYKLNLEYLIEAKTKELKQNYERTLYSMVELIEKRDTYTAGHSKRVAHYCELIANDMGYSKDECTTIYQAGILHDIGKIETPDSILLNPNNLNDIEYKIIQEHVIVGYKLLKHIPMFEHLADIIYAHHERYDGHGYPNKLKADEINKFSRIMILTDSFDAMTTSRIYKSRKSIPEAIKELETCSGKQFDPKVVESAMRVLKDIKIDNTINQLPKTKLEEEKFAYFYKDTISETYNQNYLDVVLMKNSYEFTYNYMIKFTIHNFSQYNKINSWEQGNAFLKEFANKLVNFFNDELIFRVFGDDFVVLSKNEIKIERLKQQLDIFIDKKCVQYKVNIIDLTKVKITTTADIEHY